MFDVFFGSRCECPEDFTGPRCQQTHHSFSGKGWAWYKPLAQCEDSHTSLEFVTRTKDGLILYNGPIRDLEPGEDKDFILLELRSGYPVLRANHGSGEAKLVIDGRDARGQLRMHKLNDGHWHKIDIHREGRVRRNRYFFIKLGLYGDTQRLILNWVNGLDFNGPHADIDDLLYI